MALSAFEKLKLLEGRPLREVKLQFEEDELEPWVDGEYRTGIDFISLGKTNVIGKVSDSVSKAKRDWQNQ